MCDALQRLAQLAPTLSEKELRVLLQLTAAMNAEHTAAPSSHQLAEATKLARSNLISAIDSLTERGLIRQLRGCQRTLSKPSSKAEPARAMNFASAKRQRKPESADKNPMPHRPGAQALAGALCAAIDAAVAASEYAQIKSLYLQWNAGDIRALAATLFIESRKAEK